MKKQRKGNAILDIVIAVMFISTVLLFCYSLATSAINQRHQAALERDALIVAENIMNRVLSQGAYTIKSEPMIDQTTLSQISTILNDSKIPQTEKNEKIMELGGRLPINTDVDATFLAPGNGYSYQVIVDDYISKTGQDSAGNDTFAKHASLKRITVNVYYPTRVAKYLAITEEDKANGTASKKDTTSLEEEYRVVTLTTYKSAREYWKE